MQQITVPETASLWVMCCMKSLFPVDCCARRGLQGGKCGSGQVCWISGPAIRCWHWSHQLEYRWYGLYFESAGECSLRNHFKCANALLEGIVHLLDQIWSLVAANRHSGAPKNHSTACNECRISNNASCQPYIRVNWVNEFWWQFHNQYVWAATYWQCEESIFIYQQS